VEVMFDVAADDLGDIDVLVKDVHGEVSRLK
jgi:hypothetical protein